MGRVYVKPHTRKGRRVRGHWRITGGGGASTRSSRYATARRFGGPSAVVKSSAREAIRNPRTTKTGKRELTRITASQQRQKKRVRTMLKKGISGSKRRAQLRNF